MSVVNEMRVLEYGYLDKIDIYAHVRCEFQVGAGTMLDVLELGNGDSTAVFAIGSVGKRLC